MQIVGRATATAAGVDREIHGIGCAQMREGPITVTFLSRPLFLVAVGFTASRGPSMVTRLDCNEKGGGCATGNPAAAQAPVPVKPLTLADGDGVNMLRFRHDVCA